MRTTKAQLEQQVKELQNNLAETNREALRRIAVAQAEYNGMKEIISRLEAQNEAYEAKLKNTEYKLKSIKDDCYHVQSEYHGFREAVRMFVNKE